jgi:Dna[CI] antecedent, DciA
LLAQHRRNAALQRAVCARLPGYLADHCLGCVARDDLLTVYTDSATWATPLRFALPDVLTKMPSRPGAPFRRTQVRVLFRQSEPTKKAGVRTPGSSVIRHLEETADGCPCSELQSSLIRLAATCRERKR